MRRFAERNGFDDYEALQRWSVTDLEGFWQARLADFFGLERTRRRARCSARARCRAPSGSRARRSTTPSTCSSATATRVAVVARSHAREPFELTFDELREQVARARAGLQRLGVGAGDRVVAYLPNIPETLVAFLATREPRRDLGERLARVRRRAA